MKSDNCPETEFFETRKHEIDIIQPPIPYYAAIW